MFTKACILSVFVRSQCLYDFLWLPHLYLKGFEVKPTYILILIFMGSCTLFLFTECFTRFLCQNKPRRYVPHPGDFDWGLPLEDCHLRSPTWTLWLEDSDFDLRTPTWELRLQDSDLRTRPKELKFQLWLRLSEKCQKNLRRTVVCGCGYSDCGLRLRTRPKQLKFQLWFRLSEKCQRNLRRTVVVVEDSNWRLQLRTRPKELKFQLCQSLWSRFGQDWVRNAKKLERTVVVVVDSNWRLRIRTRPKELKFQLWFRLSEKCKKNLRRTVVD